MKLGIFIPSLGHNQEAIQVITGVNTLLNSNLLPDVYPSLFYKEIDMPFMKPKTIATTFDKLYNYDGHLITTNLDTTYIALNCRRLKSINFYVQELEWTKQIGSYIANIKIYNNDKVRIFAPSKEFANALYNYCNIKELEIIPGLNVYEIATRIRSRN